MDPNTKIGQPIINPVIILACDCGKVCLHDAPAFVTPNHCHRWEKPAPALCPECMVRALRPPDRRPRRHCQPTEQTSCHN